MLLSNAQQPQYQKKGTNECQAPTIYEAVVTLQLIALVATMVGFLFLIFILTTTATIFIQKVVNIYGNTVLVNTKTMVQVCFDFAATLVGILF